MDIDRLIKRKKRVQRDGSLKQLAEIVKELGDAYYEIGKYEEALQEYKEQLETCEALGDKLNAAVAHRMIGETHVNLGNYEDALEHQNLYLEGAKETENSLEEQRAYATVGRTYFCWAESLPEASEKRPDALRSAKKAYMKSIRICNMLENTDIGLKELSTMRARLLLNLGLVLEAQQDHKEAVNLMEKAATICESHNLREDFHRTQIALGGIYDRKRDYDLALKHFELATEVDDSRLKAEAQVFQAELLLKLEQWHESRKILVSLYVADNLPTNTKNQVEKLLRIVATLHATEAALNEEESTDSKLKLYETLGDAAVAAYCFEKAIEYYRKMLDCAEEIKSDRTGAALLSLAQTLKDVGRYHEALDFAERELKLCVEPREICRSALYLADLMIITDAADENIQQIYDLAFTNAEACKDVALQISVLKERLNYLEKLDRMEEVKVLKEKLAALLELSSNADSESECEENDNIGADIRLEELSDVEEELIAKENIKSRKRTRKKGAAVKRNEKGETELHVACINGNVEAARKLLESGHATNVRDHFGWTPLHEAANHNHIEIAKLLLKYGADINDSGSLMCQGVTPLHDAASCGNLTMMRLLIEHGANVQLKTNEDETVIDCLEQWRNRVDSLSPEDEVEYDEMFKLLCAMIPKSIRKNSKRHIPESPSTSKTHIVEENVVVPEKISPGEDYKRTIANLKHRNDPIGIPVSAKRNVNPLLNTQEIIVDDWLEDDMNETVNHRRRSDEHAASFSKRKSTSSIDIDKISKRQKINTQDSISIESEPDVAEDTSNDSCNTEIIQVSSERKIPKRKQQSSLLSIGFTKNPVSRTPSPVIPSPTEFESKESGTTKSIILNVSVDGKMFKTQVECSSTMIPTVQDITRDIETKFYNDTGCKAKLELKTMENIAINSNNLSTILNESDIIKNLTCDMIELETGSLCDRYGTICKNYNIDVREQVSKCLKSCENTFILRLKQEDIKREEFISLLKALEYQRNIQILDLSGGELNETGEILNNCILRLPGLQELCLQECDIDSKCLSKLKKLPPQLKLLDLSYNPLGFTSQEILSKLLTPLTQLRTLNLRYCQLRDFKFLNTTNLVHLDISWNNFNEDKPFPVLQRQLLHLNLSNTVSSRECNIAKTILNKTDFSPINLECLELSSCALLDSDIEYMLSQLTNLSKLVLRGNKNIGAKSLNLLLGHTPTLRYIDISGCDDISDFPSSDTYIENPEICTLVASVFPEVCDYWLQLWRKRATVKKLVHNLTIFKPILSFGS